ncbi:MAG TPA: DMT family transporter [Thermoanaerobaculia bacterium]|nr:DMT family transporter [Thermoanaerobaculia bacterium]
MPTAPRAASSPAIKARLGLLAAALLFSSGGAAIKAVHLTGIQVACFRSGIAALALFALLPRARRLPRPRDLAVGVAYSGTMICFVLANKLTTAASTIFLQATAPLYLLLLGPWLLAEPVRRRDLGFMAALAAGLGMFFVGLDQASATAPDPLRGNLIALLSGLCWALTMVGFRFLGRGGGSAATAAVGGNLLAFVVCLPFALPVAASRPADWAILVYLGVFQIGLAYAFLTTAVERVPALEASLLLLLEPVLNPVWAWLVHGERPSPWSLGGGAVILVATLVKGWIDFRSPAPARLDVLPID